LKQSLLASVDQSIPRQPLSRSENFKSIRKQYQKAVIVLKSLKQNIGTEEAL